MRRLRTFSLTSILEGAVCSCIDLNLRLGSLVVRVVCMAFCLGGGSWVRGGVIEVFEGLD